MTAFNSTFISSKGLKRLFSLLLILSISSWNISHAAASSLNENGTALNSDGFPSGSFVGTPINDNCTLALTLNAGELINWETYFASSSLVSCHPNPAGTVWYEYTPSCNELVAIHGESLHGFLVSVFEGDCPSDPSEIYECSPSNADNINMISFFTTANTTYYIMVSTHGLNSPTGQGTLKLESLGCSGCTDSEALNYDSNATLNDGSCITPDSCPGDFNGDNAVSSADLSVFLANFGAVCNEELFYADSDEDGYGDPNNSISASTAPVGYVLDNTDCNDFDYFTNPGAAEICDDGIDNNCDGETDEGNTNTYYADEDSDGYGDEFNIIMACFLPDGYVQNFGDCNDLDDTTNPGAVEICDDGIDNNCDGETDEGNSNTYYADEDGDGYGDEFNTIMACFLPDGYVLNYGDCNDFDDTTNPGAPEIAGDELDNNCNGVVDE